MMISPVDEEAWADLEQYTCSAFSGFFFIGMVGMIG